MSALQASSRVTAFVAPGRSVVPFVPVCASFASRSTPVHKRQHFAAAPSQQRPQQRVQPQVCQVANSDKLISSTEVPAFIPRDDLMDQMLSWSKVEAVEAGQRNFGMPMTLEPQYVKLGEENTLWGFTVGIFREGNKVCDLSVSFDRSVVLKHEYIGIGEDGFPTLEGRAKEILGKNFEIWKLGATPVDEDLRSTIRAYCTALAQALNRYYAFGSVFVDDAQ